MPSVYDIKPAFQNILRPFVKLLANAGITANMVTIFAVILSGVGGYVIFQHSTARWPLLLLPCILFLRMALNAIDGMLAKEHNMKSKLGAILNELGDVFSDALLYLPLLFLPEVWDYPVYGMVLLATISEMCGVIAVQIGASRRYDGPMGKSDRALVIGLVSLLLATGIIKTNYLNPVFIVTCGLLILTIVNRCRNALKEAS